MQNFPGENEFYLHENKQSFSYQWLCTQPRFETEAWGTSEMAYQMMMMVMMMMMMIVIIPKERTANENAARIRVDQQPKDITYFSNKKFAPVVGVQD